MSAFKLIKKSVLTIPSPMKNDRIFTLFEFENKFFNKFGLKTTFIGHPVYHISSVNEQIEKKYIAFLP